MPLKCWIIIFKTDTKIIESAFKTAIKKVYDGEKNIPIGTSFEIGEWNDTPQIEIIGKGEDERCAFCNYFRQIVGEDKTKRNNCPF